MKRRMMMTMLIGALLLGAGTIETVEAAMVVNDPNQLIGTGSLEYISMDFSGDNLMERVGGTDVVFDKGAGEAYVLLGEESAGVVEWSGWFGTNNISSDNDVGYEAWCEGEINRLRLPSGSVPNYELGFYDDDGGQFALLYSSGILVFDANIEFFPGIEYDGVIGGLTSLPIGSEVKHTVIVPEPATLTLLAVGGLIALRRRRSRK